MTRVTRAAAPALVAGLAAALLAGAACGEDEPEPLDVAPSEAIDVVATEMAYDPDRIVVPAGTVAVTIRNEGRVIHDLRIRGVAFVVEAGPGEDASSQVTLQPGRYQIFCSLPGHLEAGMEGVLEVR